MFEKVNRMLKTKVIFGSLIRSAHIFVHIHKKQKYYILRKKKGK